MLNSRYYIQKDYEEPVAMKIKSLANSLTPPILWQLFASLRSPIIHTAKKTLVFGTVLEPTGLDLLNKNPSKNKIIYVHIHKCAGTSIRKTLQNYPNFICCVGRPGNFPSRLSRDYINDSIWQNSFKFTFVRNPYDRVVSVYKMFVKFKSQDTNFENFEEFVDFIRWCDVEHHQVDEEIPLDIFSRRIENIIHYCSSFHNPKYKIDEMDFVGRVEAMNEDMQCVLEKLCQENITIAQLNVRSSNNYREYYTAKTKKIVERKYEKDLERFAYQF